MLVVSLALISLPFLLPLIGKVDVPAEEIGNFTWLIVILSAIMNLAIIAYHYVVPAHPKFTVIPFRRGVLAIHIISGSVELVAGLFACFGSHQSPWPGTLMALAALGGHIPSASLQTPIVFGMKAIMTPAYILCVGLHAFAAVNLLLHPTSTFWAINTFLIFNIYVWCRVYYYLFDAMKIFTGSKYTVSILAAGMTTLPAMMGPSSMLALTLFIATYMVAYRRLYVTNEAGYDDFVRERARDTAISREMLSLWRKTVDPATDEKLARRYFDLLDQDHNGILMSAEVGHALGDIHLSDVTRDAFLLQKAGATQLNFLQFQTHIWSIEPVSTRGRRIVATRDATSERDRAELVFRQLDVDNNGLLGHQEINALLLEWGCPEGEASRYLKHIDSDGDGMINFDDFYQKMRAVWRFIYFDVYEAEAAQTETDMLIRTASSVREAMLVKRQRATIEEELLSRVPFLGNASEMLIKRLAESLVRENPQAGAVIFAEGSPGERFYLVEQGTVQIIKDDEVISVLGAGSYFGEGALISNEPRAATAKMASDGVLHSLSRASFVFVTERFPEVKADIENLHRARVASNVKRSITGHLLARTSFLKSASEQLLGELASTLEPRTFAAGAVVIKEGEEGDCLFLVESGRVRISKHGQTLADLSSGACVGEAALLSRAPRVATVTALEQSRLLCLKQDQFDAIIAQYPDFAAEFRLIHRTRTAAPFDLAKRDQTDPGDSA